MQNGASESRDSDGACGAGCSGPYCVCGLWCYVRLANRTSVDRTLLPLFPFSIPNSFTYLQIFLITQPSAPNRELVSIPYGITYDMKIASL